MASKPEDTVEAAPDPDEDDLDDLDDVLDAFDPKPSLPAQPKPTASGPGRPPQSPPPISTASADTSAQDDKQPPQAPPPTALPTEESLEAQLQAGMASLVSSLGDNPEMQAQFEAMMQELIAAGNAGTDDEARERVERATDIALPKHPAAEGGVSGGSAAGGSASAGAKKKDDFQDTIRKTMERMQNSDTSAASASAKSSAPKSEEEMLMEMLQSLGGAEGLGGEGGEEDFNTMLLNMMTQLVNKDILYEPMKELDQKFPGWMEKNASSVKADDLVRYKEQQRLVREIVARFERKGYSDDNEEDRDYIVERMQKMQEAGSPPPDLVGDMSAAQEALGELDQGCPTQ